MRLARLGCLWGLLLWTACGPQQKPANPAPDLRIEETPAKVDFRIRKGHTGILVLRIGPSGMFWYVMNESDPQPMTLDDLPDLVAQYEASRQIKGTEAAYSIDADEDMRYEEVGKLIRALRAIGVEKFTLMSGILKN